MREICVYLALTSSILLRPRSLFVSPRYPSRSFSKNALSFFLHQVIVDANALWEGTTPLAHNIRGVADVCSVPEELVGLQGAEAATWRSNPVFTSFYFRDISYSLDNCSSIGPFVAAGFVLT